MKKIYLLGDVHTVTVFKLAGIEGIVTDENTVLEKVRELTQLRETAIVIVTRELAENVKKEIHEMNLTSQSSVIIEIPGIDDERGFGTSSLEYITEALGVSV